MPTLRKLSETKFYIGTTAADPTGDTFTEIGGAYAAGNFGEMWKTVDSTSFADAYSQVEPVLRDPGAFDLKCRRLEAVASGSRTYDAGQVALKTAYDSRGGIYNFKVDVGGDGDNIVTFKAKVLSFVRGAQNPSALNEVTAKIQIVGATTETLAA